MNYKVKTDIFSMGLTVRFKVKKKSKRLLKHVITLTLYLLVVTPSACNTDVNNNTNNNNDVST